jgi:ABC-type antimicrobial peptide transport system permease subunit
VIAALQNLGVSNRTELTATKHLLDQDAYALSLNLYLVAALAAVVLALAGLAVNMAVQLPDRRRDAASLRVVGVRRRQLMRAVFAEICAVLGAAGLAGILAGSAAQYLVVRTLTLGLTSGIRTPRVVPTLDVSRMGLLVATVLAVMVAVATVVASLAVRQGRGSILRESTR